MYAYCHNDPVNKSDPSGLDSTSVGTPTGSHIPSREHPDGSITGSAIGAGIGGYGGGSTYVDAPRAGTTGLAGHNRVFMAEISPAEEEANEAEVDPVRASEDAREEKEEEEQYGHKTGSIRPSHSLVDIVKSWFGMGPIAQAEAAQTAASTSKAIEKIVENIAKTIEKTLLERATSTSSGFSRTTPNHRSETK